MCKETIVHYFFSFSKSLRSNLLRTKWTHLCAINNLYIFYSVFVATAAAVATPLYSLCRNVHDLIDNSFIISNFCASTQSQQAPLDKRVASALYFFRIAQKNNNVNCLDQDVVVLINANICIKKININTHWLEQQCMGRSRLWQRHSIRHSLRQHIKHIIFYLLLWFRQRHCYRNSHWL